MRQPILWRCSGTSALVRIAEHRGTNLVKLIPHRSHHLTVAFRRGLDSEGPQQRGRGHTRVAGFAQSRVQSLVSQMVKDQVNDAPRVEGLGLWRLASGHRHLLSWK